MQKRCAKTSLKPSNRSDRAYELQRTQAFEHEQVFSRQLIGAEFYEHAKYININYSKNKYK
jgi:hypothetical protein